MKKWVIAIVRPICMVTTAMVWVIINMSTYHYLIETMRLSAYSSVILSVAFPISALSGAGYLVYKWFCGLRPT